jgi:hypothetical protein
MNRYWARKGLAMVAGLGLCIGGGMAAEARPIGWRHKTVVVQQAPTVYTAQAPTTYVAQAPATYMAQAPATYVAQAPATYVPQAPAVAAAPATSYVYYPAAAGSAPAVGSAPAEAPCALAADERRDIVEELRQVKQENRGSTPSERRQAVKERAAELVAEACDKEVDELTDSDKALVRSIVSEAMAPTAQTWSSTQYGSGGYVGAGYCTQPGTAPAPMVPLIPIYAVPPPKHCVHRVFGHCAKCCNKRY